MSPLRHRCSAGRNKMRQDGPVNVAALAKRKGSPPCRAESLSVFPSPHPGPFRESCGKIMTSTPSGAAHGSQTHSARSLRHKTREAVHRSTDQCIRIWRVASRRESPRTRFRRAWSTRNAQARREHVMLSAGQVPCCHGFMIVLQQRLLPVLMALARPDRPAVPEVNRRSVTSGTSVKGRQRNILT